MSTGAVVSAIVDANGLRELYDHHAWAMGVVLGHASLVTEEQAQTMRFHGLASLEDTLAHVVRAERYWLATWRGVERSALPWVENIAELADRWMNLQAETRAFLGGLSDGDLARPMRLSEPIPGRDTLAAGIMHVVLHGAQHRAEAAVLLSDFGRSPGELDYIDFLEHREALLRRH